MITLNPFKVRAAKRLIRSSLNEVYDKMRDLLTLSFAVPRWNKRRRRRISEKVRELESIASRIELLDPKKDDVKAVLRAEGFIS